MKLLRKPIRIESHYGRRSLTAIYLLLVVVCCLPGVLAFSFDRLTIGSTRWGGRWHDYTGLEAHAFGVAGFLVGAYCLYRCLREYRSSTFVLTSPFIVAIVASAVLLHFKYG